MIKYEAMFFNFKIIFFKIRIKVDKVASGSSRLPGLADGEVTEANTA